MDDGTRSHLIGNSSRVLGYRIGEIRVLPFRSLEHVSLGSQPAADHIFHAAARHIHHLGGVTIYFTCGTNEMNRVKLATTPRKMSLTTTTSVRIAPRRNYQRPKISMDVPVRGEVSWKIQTAFRLPTRGKNSVEIIVTHARVVPIVFVVGVWNVDGFARPPFNSSSFGVTHI